MKFYDLVECLSGTHVSQNELTDNELLSPVIDHHNFDGHTIDDNSMILGNLVFYTWC